jgi:hypothetical protein
MDFVLEVPQLQDIRLRQDVMEYRNETYDFMAALRRRTDEREESFLRGVSIEPLVVNGHDMELMDGYTRYTVLQKYKQEKVYVYVGHIH